MLDVTERIIIQNWFSHDVSFVFPSEVAALFWAKTLLDGSQRKSVFTDRFISWDIFKGLYFRGKNELKPANKAARLLFAFRYCQKKPRLAVLFPKDGTSETFAPFLAGILPQLDILDTLDTRNITSSTKIKLNDLKELKTAYTEFLEREGFFEPSWERKKNAPTGTYHIFFPAVIDDFFEYEADLASWKIPLSGDDLPPVSSLVLHKTFYDEVHTVLDTISELLVSGTAVEDIVISCADLPRVQGFLKAEASLRGLSLSFRQGTELGDTVVGSWVRALSAWFALGNFSDLRTILLCGPFRLKDEDAGLAFLKAGIDAGCVFERPSRRWLDILDVRPPAEGQPETPEQQKRKRAQELYRVLVKKLENLSKTTDLSAWAGALQSLISEVYDVESINTANKNIWDYYLSKSRSSDTGLELNSASERSFLHDQFLLKEIYVEKALSGSVAVYPYRVAAGIRPKHHFILNLDENACRVEAREPDFFCDLEKADLGIRRYSLTEAFLKLYAQSGENVYLSASAEGAAGNQSVPSSCLHAVVTSPGLSFDRQVSAKKFWKGEEAKYSASSEELAALKDWVLRRKQKPGKMQISVEAINKLVDVKNPVYSAYQIKALVNCPFSFLMNAHLGLHDYPVEPDILSAKQKGNILHRILENFLQKCMEDKSVLNSDLILEQVVFNAEKYERRIGSPFRELFFSSLDLTWTANHLLALAGNALKDPQRMFTEKPVTLPLPKLGAGLSGRVDILFLRDAESLVLDLKSGAVPSNSCIIGERRPYETQVALYCLALEESGISNLQGAYFSILESKIAFIKEHGRNGKLWNTTEMKAMIEKKLHSAGLKIGIGCYSPEPDENGCRLCGFRPVCRARFFGGWDD